MTNKKIAFKSHRTRGQEIIKILEGMGGVNVFNHKGNFPIEWDSAYYIYGDNTIQSARIDFLRKLEYKIYTLEEYNDLRASKLLDVCPYSSTD